MGEGPSWLGSQRSFCLPPGSLGRVEVEGRGGESSCAPGIFPLPAPEVSTCPNGCPIALSAGPELQEVLLSHHQYQHPTDSLGRATPEPGWVPCHGRSPGTLC